MGARSPYVHNDDTGTPEVIQDCDVLTLRKLTIGIATVGEVVGVTGSLELKGITSGTVTIKVADEAGTYTLTLPTDDGSENQVLKTDGSGVLSWTNQTGGIPTAITVADETTDTSCYIAFFKSATGDLEPKTNAGLLYNSNTNVFGISTAIGATSSDGLTISNPTAATAGNQKWSPRLRLSGQGWKTDETAGSQTVDWILENRPVQGTAAPTSTLVWAYQVDGGGYADKMTLTNAGVLTVSSVVGNVTGNCSGSSGSCTGNSATVTTNANLTGIVTSVGNATAIADKAISYTKLADGTDGQLITWDADGHAATVATGTATHVLTSNGAGAAPTFQALPAATVGDLQTFSASGAGTWTKPTDFTPKFVKVILIGAGGGGGSGAKTSYGSRACSGGGGGGGGVYIEKIFNAADLGATVSVNVGAGGTGGASQTSTASNGNVGNVGGNTTFGTYLTAYGGAGGGAGYYSTGGTGGSSGGGGGGSASVGTVGNTGNAVYGGDGGLPFSYTSTVLAPPVGGAGAKGIGITTTPTGVLRVSLGEYGGGGGDGCIDSGNAGGGSSLHGAGGGGSGGGMVSNNNTLYGATAGGTSNAYSVGGGGAGGNNGASPTAGSNGAAGTSLKAGSGGGGGGGTMTSNTNGEAGGNGGQPGGGGGGGGSGFNTGNSGAGGTGGNGYIWVWSY